MIKHFLLIALSMGLMGCNQSEITRLESEIFDLIQKQSDLEFQISSLEERNYELLNVIYDIESASSDLDWELDRLSSEVDDFEWEEWRTNVWDIENQVYRVVVLLRSPIIDLLLMQCS